MYPSYDRSTQQTLIELERLVSLGQKQEVNDLMNRVINGVGYIQPLAKIYYRLAQTETNTELLAQYYITIVKHFSKSAWAQQAVIDFVPVLLMSDDRFGQETFDQIWSNMPSLLNPAPDANDIPENAEVLRAQVFLRLVQLSHHRREAERILELKQSQAAATVTDKKDMIELANVFALMRLQNTEVAETNIKQWLQNFPQSDWRPFAMLTLYQVTNDKALQEEITRQIFTEYNHSLEAEIVKSYISAGTH